MSLYLHGLGHFHPENQISNAFLEALDIGTTEPWISGARRHSRAAHGAVARLHQGNAEPRRAGRGRSGQVHERRDGRARGADGDRARRDSPADIGMVITGSSAPDTLSPADACNVAAALGLEVPAFDMNSACTSYFIPIHLLSMMQPDKLPPFVLVVVPESLTRTVDYSDRTTAVLWGDGAAAAVLSTRERGRAEYIGTMLDSSPAGHDKVVVPRYGYLPPETVKRCRSSRVKRMADSVKRLREAHATNGARLGFVGHQANLRMLESVCKLCSIPAERHFSNVEQFGNTAAAGSPSVLSMRWDEWAKDDEIAVVGVGAGLTWAGYLLRFSR